MEGKPLRLTPHEYCIRSGQIALLDEWDKMGNHSLKPGGAFFKSGSGLMEVRCGHGWKTTVFQVGAAENGAYAS